MSGGPQRRELGALLRARREQIVRAERGLPPVGRSRTTGLRREEVAFLSGVSVTWYTWLEQGRDIQPSRQVLSALARPLGLSAAEHAYVLSLVGYSPRETSPEPQTPDAPGDVQRLLDSLHGSPAFAITRNWSIVGWNAAYSALYPNIAAATPPDRNLLWLVFTDPFVRQLLPDWDLDSRRFLAEFRTEVGPHLGESAVTAVVDRLHATSEAFRAGWSSHDIEGFSSRERIFQHPLGKGLRLEQHRLTPADHPELHVVIYTPVDDGHTPAALRGGDPWH